MGERGDKPGIRKTECEKCLDFRNYRSIVSVVLFFTKVTKGVVMAQDLRLLQKYYPSAASELAVYSPGSLLRFSCVISRRNRFEDGWLMFVEHDKLSLAVYLSNEAFDQNLSFIKCLFSEDFEKLNEMQEFLESSSWRTWTVTIYGQIIFIEESTVYFEANYFWPQTFQSELDKKRIKPTAQLVINKVTEKQAKDFQQRKKALSELFRGEKE